jgi:prevent-host-death family protein
MVRRLSAKEARDRFAEILGQVHFGKDTVIVEKQGKPVAAVIGVERYEELLQAWEAPFGVLDRVAAKNPAADPAQVQAGVAEAVAAVRAATRTKSRKRA